MKSICLHILLNDQKGQGHVTASPWRRRGRIWYATNAFVTAESLHFQKPECQNPGFEELRGPPCRGEVLEGTRDTRKLVLQALGKQIQV
jgi:hypothetical protein